MTSRAGGWARSRRPKSESSLNSTNPRQADLIEELPELKAKAKAEEQARLETIERRLGLNSGDGSLAEVDVAEIARKKIKFDDDKFLEETREIKDSVRSAVGAALLKKKKKKAGETKKVEVAKKVAERKADSVKMPPPAVKA